MRVLIISICLFLCYSVSFSQKKQNLIQNNHRIEKTINSNWTFNYFSTDDTRKTYEAFGFDDSKWPAVSIPHTWRTYETTGEMDPFIVRSAEDDNMYWWTGWGWYRKHFSLNREYIGRKVFLEFDGVQKNCKVWLNGKLLGEHKGAFGSFDFDITSLVKPEGSDNVLAVAVNNFQEGTTPYYPDAFGGFNEYGGLIRNVRLVLKDPMYIPFQGTADHEGGTFVTVPSLSDKEAVIRVQTWVKNDYPAKKNCTLQTTILDAAGKTVQVISTQSSINPGQLYMFDQTFKPVKSPRLWSPENPYLYSIRSEVIDGNSVVDVYMSPLGLRTVNWDSNSKMLTLNGKKVELKGGNRRQDYPWLGAAVPDWLILLDMQWRDKTPGYNFLRTIYNEDSRVVYEQADKLGILIDEETFSIADKNSSQEEIERKVKENVRSNRNHPSVISWSFGNEAGFKAGSKVATAEDPTRQVLPSRIPPDVSTPFYNYDFNVSKRNISEKEGEAAKIMLTVSENKIDAFRGSLAIVTAQLADINGNSIPGAPRNIRWKITGPATLAGPENFRFDETDKNQGVQDWYKGFPAVNVIRSTGVPGTIKVSVFSSGLASGSIEITATEIKYDNSVFSEPMLTNEGRRPVARLIINIDRLDEVNKEIAYAPEPLSITATDKQGFLQAVREYLKRNNPEADTTSVEFRALAGILAVQLQNNRGTISTEDYNYNIDHYNNCRLITSYIMATKLPALFKEGLRKYYSRSVITLGSEKNAGDEMNWLNWIPSGGTVVVVKNDNIKTGIKGIIYTDKSSLEEIISVVYPQFRGFSSFGKERALTFINKMNPYVYSSADPSNPDIINYTAKPGEMILIPLYKFISE